MRAVRYALLASALLVVTGPLRAQETDPPADEAGTTVVDVARTQGVFTTLLDAIDAAGLTETLMGEGPFTVFAPTDEAFAALAEGTLDDLLMEENRDTLVELLSYHVVPGRFLADDLVEQSGMSGARVETLAGPLSYSNAEGALTVGGAEVMATDIEASNGVIHVVGSVIMPPGN